ncbi:glycosyl hydrolase family 28-related protein [Citreimonas salinaria]|uniref:Pectate lyase superfamily protein n=1 Tax=Citreimonas salinaria TaxID=321339 RepID=A0A1H3F183_9RHOB|nr:glycosyl hydrolase family 28-related protein [Citreimonas salinaria]SDX83944.1 Pectate lyase superfamily protein [Citreimonas salinaria]
MGFINISKLHHAIDDKGSVHAGAKRYVYHENSERLCTLYGDPGLTRIVANPMIADAEGNFPPCYLVDGVYRVDIVTNRGVLIYSDRRVFIQSPLEESHVHKFRSLRSLLESRTMCYEGRSHRYTAIPGEFVHILDGSFVYQIVPASQPHAHLTTAGGIKLNARPDRSGRYNALAFGADPTGVRDSWAAIQGCIDASYLGSHFRDSHSGVAFVPAGRYRISQTLHVGYGFKGSDGPFNIGFQSVILEGAGECNNGMTTNRGTTIVADFSDRPAINIQGARATVVQGFTVLGKLDAHIKSRALGTPQMTDNSFDSDAWVDDVTYPGTADSRHAPYAGISIDAFAGAKPVGGYPDISYPGYLGHVPQYNKNFTSRASIRNVEIVGFNTAIAQQPCDADGNADFSNFADIRIQRCKYGISIGNSQSRAVTGRQVIFNQLFCALTNNKHGKQSGTFGGVLTGFSFDAIVNLVEFRGTAQPGGTGPTRIEGFHGEKLWRIGEISGGGGPDDATITFADGNLSFGLQGKDHGVPLSVLSPGAGRFLGGDASVHFQNIQFKNHPTHLFFDCDPSALRFDGCQFDPSDVPATAADRASCNATLGGLLLHNAGNVSIGNGLGRATIISVRTNSYDVDTGARAKIKVGPRDPRGRAYGISPYCETTGPQYFRLTVPILDGAATLVNQNQVSASSVSGITWTITFNSRADATFVQAGPLPGDVLIDRNSGQAFIVRTRSELTVTADAVTGYVSDGFGGFEFLPVNARGTGVVQAFNPANFQAFILNSRYYAVQSPLWGTTTSGSATISVGDDDGTATQIEASITEGDALAINRHEFRPFAEANAVVASRSNASGTISMGGNAVYSRRIPIVQMVRRTLLST